MLTNMINSPRKEKITLDNMLAANWRQDEQIQHDKIQSNSLQKLERFPLFMIMTARILCLPYM